MRLTGVFIVFLLLSVCAAKGQFTDYGSDPARIKWKRVKMPHYMLIYPDSNDSVACRYARFLEQAYPRMGKTIGVAGVRSFPVILHPGNMQSNGMVVWAPRRMELITTPPATLDAQPWDKHLVLHESRHVMQMYKLSQGIFRPLQYVLGEQTAGVASFFVPKWFFEGDAVATETAMSNGGRGRLPEFSMCYRARMLAGDFYSYDKWALGSFKDYTGNFYALGYNLVAYARYRYGPDVWDKVTSRYTRRFFNIPPFASALREVTGISAGTLFRETFLFLNREEWTAQDSVYRHSGFRGIFDCVTPETKKYISYDSPQAMGDSAVIAVKTCLDDVASLVMIRDGKEVRLCYLGNINSRIVRNGNRVYWTEYVPGLRRRHENFSELKYYDFISRRIVTVTSGQRFLAPAVHKAGKVAAVSQPADSGVNRVVLLDLGGERTGEIFRSYDVPFNGFVKEIAFTDEHCLAAVVVYDKGLSLFRLELPDGRWSELMGPTFANVTSLTECGGRLFFESGLNGVNNIYSFDLLTSECFRLTTSRFGAFAPAFSEDGKRLFFSDYLANGARIASIPVDRLPKQPADFSRTFGFALAEAVARQEAFNSDTDFPEKVDFRPEPYRKGSHLFRVHSWTPFYYDAARVVSSLSDDLSTIVKPGCMILSQNLLSTAVTQAGWYYDRGYHFGQLAFTYRGWFPVVRLNVDYGGKAFDYEWRSEEGENSKRLVYRLTDRNLVEAKAMLYVPFDFTRNHYISGLQPSVTCVYTNNRYPRLDGRKAYPYRYLLGELRYYRYRKLALRDILPRLGFQVQLQYLNVPAGRENFGSLYAAKLIAYLPGPVRGHGLMLRAMYQYQDKEGNLFYIPQGLVSQARGYRYTYQTWQRTEWKADYAFGLFCPDWSAGGLAYVKRIRSNLFYDLSVNWISRRSGWTRQSSCGADLIFDCNLLRLSYPTSLGVRVIQSIEYGSARLVEGLFSITF
jgi:hypothetical protein